MFHILLISHVYDLTFISAGGGDAGGVPVVKAAKPVTSVQG